MFKKIRTLLNESGITEFSMNLFLSFLVGAIIVGFIIYFKHIREIFPPFV